MVTIILTLESYPLAPFDRKMITVDVVEGNLNNQELATLARDYLELVRHENRPRWFRRRQLAMPYVCRVSMASDDPELKIRRESSLLHVRFGEDEPALHLLGTCLHCGWQDNTVPFRQGEYYCSNAECQALARQAYASKLKADLAARHAGGVCGFEEYYQQPCDTASISRDEPFCAKHRGLTCSFCDKQAIRENGISGSVNYTWLVCLDHADRMP